MRAKSIKGKKFHYEGEDETGAVVLNECVDDEHGTVVRLERLKSGEPVKMGGEICQLRPDGSGHFEIDALDMSGDSIEASESSGGPAQVATSEYREGWDRIFGSKSRAN